MRTFLIVAILATITLFNFVAVLQGYRSSMAEADWLFDGMLVDSASVIAHIDQGRTAIHTREASDLAFQVWRNGRLMTHSSNSPATPITALTPGFAYANFNGYRWRVFVQDDATRRYQVVVAQRTDLRFTLAEHVILESILPTVLGLPLVGLIIWLIVGHGLAPLRKLVIQLSEKQPEDLSPLPPEKTHVELAQVTHSVNALLKRLETSLNREKRFASEAAHELRTPISALTVQLHNLSGELPEDSERLRELRAGVERMSHLVEQMLTLYRSAPDQYMASFTEIDLVPLVREVIASDYEHFERKAQQVELVGESGPMIGNRFALASLVQNLLSNANRYTPEHGQISATVTSDAEETVLVVEDSGPGIPVDQQERIFERFHRLGGVRSIDQQSCGLGLAIVKHIAELHHARIVLRPSCFQTGIAFQVIFPRQAPPAGKQA